MGVLDRLAVAGKVPPLRPRAQPPQALASAIYLFFYYLGSSVVGWVSGIVWAWAGWAGVVSMLGAVLLVAMAVALRLRGLAPLQPAAPEGA